MTIKQVTKLTINKFLKLDHFVHMPVDCKRKNKTGIEFDLLRDSF